jgi:hypothetical protein
MTDELTQAQRAAEETAAPRADEAAPTDRRGNPVAATSPAATTTPGAHQGFAGDPGVRETPPPAVATDPGMHAMYVDLQGCARCGAAHPGLYFAPLTRQIPEPGGEPFTHFALCPTNAEPVLMRSTDVPTATDAAPTDAGTA